MSEETKARILELSQELRDAAKRQEPLARTTVELIKLHGIDLRERLVSTEGIDTPRVQGAARHMDNMLRELTIDPPVQTSGAN